MAGAVGGDAQKTSLNWGAQHPGKNMDALTMSRGGGKTGIFVDMLKLSIGVQRCIRIAGRLPLYICAA
jgi:hypothetical protein